MNKNSTPKGNRIIMLTISYLFLIFAAQAKPTVNKLFNQNESGLIKRDSIFSSPAYKTLDITGNCKSVDLFWVADSELQNDHYEVERSFDMKNFKTIGLVLGALNSNGQFSQYGFIDDGKDIKNHNIVYYRLKQVDVQGSSTYGL
jgi:hypothetical protein